jgi:hypothetical protein
MVNGVGYFVGFALRCLIRPASLQDMESIFWPRVVFAALSRKPRLWAISICVSSSLSNPPAICRYWMNSLADTLAAPFYAVKYSEAVGQQEYLTGQVLLDRPPHLRRQPVDFSLGKLIRHTVHGCGQSNTLPPHIQILMPPHHPSPLTLPLSTPYLVFLSLAVNPIFFFGQASPARSCSRV